MPKRDAMRKVPAYDSTNGIGAVDRVRFAMVNNRMDALTLDEHVQYKRWIQIDDWLRSKRFINDKGEDELVAGRRKLRNLVMVKYDVSWDTAERDIENTMKLFTPVTDHKEYHRSVYIDDLEEKAQRAAAADEWGAYAAIMKLAGEWREFHKEKIEKQRDKFQAFQFIIQFNPEAIGLKTIENRDEVLARWRKRKSASDRMADAAEEAEYEIE